jgi:hypothetical protein
MTRPILSFALSIIITVGYTSPNKASAKEPPNEAQYSNLDMQGVYANVVNGQPIKYFAVTKTDEQGWTIFDSRQEGTASQWQWLSICETSACDTKQSSLYDINQMVHPDALKKYDITCVNNSKAAICSATSKVDVKDSFYMLLPVVNKQASFALKIQKLQTKHIPAELQQLEGLK